MPPSVPVQQWGDAGGMRGCRAGCRGQRKEGWFWGIAVAGLAGGLQGLHALHVPARGPGSPFFPTMGTPRPRRRPRAVGSCRCFSSIPRKADFFLISFSGQSASFPAQALLGGLGNQGAWVGARPAPGDAAPRGPAGLVAARGGHALSTHPALLPGAGRWEQHPARGAHPQPSGDHSPALPPRHHLGWRPNSIPVPPVPPVPPGWLQAGVRGPHKARLSPRGRALIPAAALPTPGGSAASSSSSQAENAWPTRIKCKAPRGRHAAGFGEQPQQPGRAFSFFWEISKMVQNRGFAVSKAPGRPVLVIPPSPPLFLK